MVVNISYARTWESVGGGSEVQGQLGMVEYTTFNPSTQISVFRRQKQADLCEFKASLVHSEFQDSRRCLVRHCLKGEEWDYHSMYSICLECPVLWVPFPVPQ